MSELARELVQQALDQDYNGANKIFGDLMGTKINDALEQEKVRLANSIYNGIEDDDMGDEDDLVGDEDGSDEQLELDLETEGESEQEGEEEQEEFESYDDEEEVIDDEDEIEES